MEELTFSDDLNFIVYHSLYLLYPTQLQALHDLKKEKKYAPNAIDLMYVSAFTSFIESVLSEAVSEYLEQKEENTEDELSLRLIKRLQQEMIRGTWEKSYKANFQAIFGLPMNGVIPEEVIKAIDALYAFRNQSGHGRQIVHQFNLYGDLDKESATLAGNYKRLHDYFLEKSLITREELLAVTFINDGIIAHFSKNVKAFVENLAENLIKREGLKMYKTLREHVLNQL